MQADDPIRMLARRVAVARGALSPDLVLKGGRVLSVFTGELLDADVAIADGFVAGVGDYDGPETLDARGLSLFPGFVDDHMPLEATQVMVDQLGRAGRPAAGHAPGLTGRDLNAYLAAGVESDHECTTYEEALEKRRRGMWIMVREGSAARNLEALLPLVLEHGPENCLLCTDDREPDELLDDGHIDAVMRKAVALGSPPYDPGVMGALSAARYHR